MIFRFFFGSMHRNAHFSGDPHPGNFRFMDDGRIAFLDFGMTKVVHREHIENEAKVLRLGMEGDAQGLFDQLAGMGFFDPEDPVMQPDRVLEHMRAVTSWYVDDREVTIDKDVVAQVLIDFGDPRSDYWEMLRHENLPPEAILGRRMEGLTVGVLGALGCTANWHRIWREWLYGDPPTTPLGEAGGRVLRPGSGQAVA